VLNELVGVEQPEARHLGEGSEPTRRYPLIALFGERQVRRGDLGLLAGQVLGALRLDRDDLVSALEQNVEVGWDPADAVGALCLERERFGEAVEASEFQESRVALPGRERIDGQSRGRPGRAHLPLELLAGAGAKRLLDLATRNPRQEVVLEFDDVAVRVALRVGVHALESLAECFPRALSERSADSLRVRVDHRRLQRIPPEAVVSGASLDWNDRSHCWCLRWRRNDDVGRGTGTGEPRVRRVEAG
jgi:hypothetical protein